MKKKTTYCLASLALVTGCSTEDSKHSKTQIDNPYYKVEKVKTVGNDQLEKTTISGPPTPPKGFVRPVVKPNKTDKIDKNITKKND